MDENLVQELQRHLWALMRRTRHGVAPIEGVSRSAARVLITAARHGDGPRFTDGPGTAGKPNTPSDQPQNGVTPGHLAEKLSMATSNVAAALRELEQAGHIERRRAVDDGRRVEVVLTTQGWGTVAAQRALRTDALRDVIHETLTAEEQAQLAAAIPLLGRLAAGGTPPAHPNSL